MMPAGDGLPLRLAEQRLSRRSFLALCSAAAAALALPAAYAPRIAAAVSSTRRVPLIWIGAQACGGDAEAFFRSSEPGIGDLLADLLSVDYLDSTMVSSGDDAARTLTEALERDRGSYVAVIEGSVPTGGNAAFCTSAGRAVEDVVRAVAAEAALTIAVGSCAFDGGLAAAAGGVTGAVGAASLAPGERLVALPGCPVNADNLAATIVHWVTFGQPPATDSRRRPLFAYGNLVHNQCERRAHFEFGEFALSWGDEGSQKGWCLYKLGCKGPETYANCPSVRYADKLSWPVRAGHGCIGCTMPGFFDAMTPAYRRLPSPIPFAPGVTADQVGQALVGGVAAMTVVHGAASFVRERRRGPGERGKGEERTAAAAGSIRAVDAEPVGVEPVDAEPVGVEPPARVDDAGDAVPERTEPEAVAVVEPGESPADQEGDA